MPLKKFIFLLKLSNFSKRNQAAHFEKHRINHNAKEVKHPFTKLQDDENTNKHVAGPIVKRFLLFENVTSPYRFPCVLDLKMGTRVRENPSSEKLARHVTAIELGARLSGMQVPTLFLWTFVFYRNRRVAS